MVTRDRMLQRMAELRERGSEEKRFFIETFNKPENLSVISDVCAIFGFKIEGAMLIVLFFNERVENFCVTVPFFQPDLAGFFSKKDFPLFRVQSVVEF